MDIFGGHYSVDHSNCPLHPKATIPLSLLASKGDCRTLWSWNSPGESQHQAVLKYTPPSGDTCQPLPGLSLHPGGGTRMGWQGLQLSKHPAGDEMLVSASSSRPPQLWAFTWGTTPSLVSVGGKGQRLSLQTCLPHKPKEAGISCLEKERPDAGQLDLMKRRSTDSPRWHKMGQVSRTENWH